MHYSKLRWRHESSTEPVEILSEYDAEGWETRKVERFSDGTLGFADGSGCTGGIELSLIRRPPDDEVAMEPEFQVLPLTKDEFERAWIAARRASRVSG